jgi:hypothetical protein
MSYPTSVELAEFAVDAKLIEGFPTDYTAYDRAIEAAIAAWEGATQWSPFLAPAEDDEREYRCWLGGLLDLQGGYASIESVTYDDEAIPATEWTDYEVRPRGSTPVRWLQLLRFPAAKLTVVGKPGYAADCPADVEQAILAFGAAQVATLLNGTGQIVEVRQGEVSYKYAVGSSAQPTTQYSQWLTLFNATVARYSRRSFA